MNLRGLRDALPHFFYPQTWWDDEPFAVAEIPDQIVRGEIVFPRTAVKLGQVPSGHEGLTPAAFLASRYVQHPKESIWRKHYLWTSDIDSQGQRVYIGDNGKGLEIHRHIHITERFGVPIW